VSINGPIQLAKKLDLQAAALFFLGGFCEKQTTPWEKCERGGLSRSAAERITRIALAVDQHNKCEFHFCKKTSFRNTF
jgi:hypothetical protein